MPKQQLSKAAKQHLIRYLLIGAPIEAIGFISIVLAVLFFGSTPGEAPANDAEKVNVLFVVLPGVIVSLIGAGIMVYGIISAQRMSKSDESGEDESTPRNLRPPQPY